MFLAIEPNNFSLIMQLDARVFLDALYQIAGHCVGQQTRTYKHVDLARGLRQEDGCLPGGISSAYYNDLFLAAQLRLHERRTIVDTLSLKLFSICNLRFVVLSAS